MNWDVSRVSVAHPTIVLARLAGKDPTAIFVFHCLDVSTDLAIMLLNVTVKKIGRELIVIFPAATTAQMDIAFHPMNVFVATDGREQIVMFARKWRAVFTDPVELTHTLVSVKKAGKDIFVTNLPATWDASMDFVMPQELQVWPIFVYVSLDGEEISVKSADPTGNAPTKMPMLAACQMNVSVMEARRIPWVCATTPFLCIT